MTGTIKTFQNILNVSKGHTNYLVNFSLRYRYIYVENPKVACTTIKRILQVAEVDGDLSKLSEDVHDRWKSPLPEIRNVPEDFQKLYEDPKTFLFCFVRNPYTRALSCYLDKFVKNRETFSHMLWDLGAPAGERLTFIDFLEIVKDQPDRDRNPHWISQSYLLQPDKLKYDFIGRFESVEEDIGRIFKKLEFTQKGWEKRAGHATSANKLVQEYYGPKEIELVQEVYEQDFKSFGYGWSLDSALD